MPRRRKGPPRRKRNTGSIAKQPDGTFWAIPPKWADPGRKPRRGFTSWEAAGAWLDAECLRIRSGGPATDPTVETYLSQWYLRVSDSAGWAPSTRTTCLTRLRRFAPLAPVRLTDLKPGQVQDVIATMGRDGLTASVICQTAALMRRALADAIDDGLVTKNVAARLTLPKVRRINPRAWTHAEVRRLLEAIEGEALEPLVGIGLVLGLRIGEILGLRWEDIDFTMTTLTVRRSYTNGQIGPPKTRRERTVKMPPRVWSALLRHRERQAPGTAWLFPGRYESRPLSYPPARLWLKRMVAKAEIRDLGSHALRHTAATVMLSNGVLPPNAAQQLGHANPGVTMGTYWSPSDDDRNPSDAVVAWLSREIHGPETDDTRHDTRQDT